MRLPRKPFWRDQQGLHVVWARPEYTNGIPQPVHLLVSTFDPLSGEALAHRVYDPFPPEVIMGGMTVYDAAGAPGGSFALVVGYPDDAAPNGYVDKIVLGHLEVEGALESWVPPWSIMDWYPIHVGWDGEAFVFDFRANSSAQVLMLRLAPDGSEVLEPTQVGGVSTIDDGSSSFHTDADTGTTWLASDYSDGVWLSGHLRDGSPLPGMEPDGFVIVEGQGVAPYWPSQGTTLATSGERALVAWGTNTVSTTHLQLVEDGQELGDALVLFDNPEGGGPYLSKKLLARLDDGWWLGGAYGDYDLDPLEMGVLSFWFADTPASGIELVGRSVLVGWPPCWPGCDSDWEKGFALRQVAAVKWQDELWFGFKDLTEHTDGIDPYRIVRVGRSCRYPTLFEIYHPELMPEQ